MPVDMDVKYTMELSDGSKLVDLSLNGNNFVSKTEITKEMFEGRLSKVVITAQNAEETKYVMHNVRLLQIATYPYIPDMPGWFFVLQEISKSEMEMMKLQANVEYIAMMSDCEL